MTISNTQSELARKTAPISEYDLIPAVSCKTPYRIPGTGKKIAIIDLGLKNNMLSSLSSRNGDLYVFPYNATPEDIFRVEPDCLFITNGPRGSKDCSASVSGP